jgi:Arc/MetJ-type ribon-helix-helix transcriptional regulator
VAYIDDGRLVIEDRRHLLARLQDEVARLADAGEGTGSVVDELLAERRADAAAEGAE